MKMAALFLTLAAAALAQPEIPENWTDGYVMVNGIRIHYWRTGGDKPVMVLAHGYSDDGLCWANLAKVLQTDYDIIMVDARGHGLSDPPAKSDAAAVQAEDIAGLLQALELEKPILMGHSMGSSSVAWFASKYPDVPRAVILEDPLLIKWTTDRKPMSAKQQEKRYTRIIEHNSTPYEKLIEECLGRDPEWGRSECEYWARSKRLYHPNNAYIHWSDRPPMDEMFVGITCPALILKADAKDDVRKQNEAIAASLPKGKIIHVGKAGHCVRRDQTDAYIQALETFLSGL